MSVGGCEVWVCTLLAAEGAWTGLLENNDLVVGGDLREGTERVR